MRTPHRGPRLVVLLLAASPVVAACGGAPATTPGTPGTPGTLATVTNGPALPGATPTPPAPGTSGSPAALPAPLGSPVQISHIHALARDRRTGQVMVATHEGLVAVVDGTAYRAGPVVDLMGFAVAPDGTYLASGHPGQGSGLPEPVGLISSTDQGRTWQVLSRAGQSDFHALAVGPRSVIGFDGALRVTQDRSAWTQVEIASLPRALTASPQSGRIIATTAAGLLSSTDDGASWTRLAPPELVVLAAWADEQTLVGVTRQGVLVVSKDAGGSWTSGPAPVGQVGALSASLGPAGEVEILYSLGTRVLRTTDLGATTHALL